MINLLETCAGCDTHEFWILITGFRDFYLKFSISAQPRNLAAMIFDEPNYFLYQSFT